MALDALTPQHLGKSVIVQGHKLTFTGELAEYDNVKRKAVVWAHGKACTVPYNRLLPIPEKAPA